MRKSASDIELLHDMSLFVEVAKQRSFSRAAASLQVSLSLVSRRIARLEKSLGLQLLNRTTRKLELTETGSHYLHRCQRLVEEAQTAHRDLRELMAVPRGHLRISIPVDLGMSVMAPLLIEFAKLYPEISVDCDVSPYRVDLISANTDVAVRPGAQPDSTLVMHPLAQLTSHVYAAPDYLKRAGTPKHPRELASHECVRVLLPHGSSTWSFRHGEQQCDVRVSGRFALNNISMVSHLVAAGMGVGVIADFLARDGVGSGQLIKLLAPWTAAPIPVMAVTANRLLPVKVRVFIEFLIARFARLKLDVLRR